MTAAIAKLGDLRVIIAELYNAKYLKGTWIEPLQDDVQWAIPTSVMSVRLQKVAAQIMADEDCNERFAVGGSMHCKLQYHSTGIALLLSEIEVLMLDC